MRGKLRSADLPPKANAAAEITVPHPPPIAWNARNSRSVREYDWAGLCFTVNHALEECRRIGTDLREFFACGQSSSPVVRCPAATKPHHVTRKVLIRRPDQPHSSLTPNAR